MEGAGELVRILADLGMVGAVLLGGGAVFLMFRKANGRNGQLMEAFRFREGAIDEIKSTLRVTGEAMVKLAERMERHQQESEHWRDEHIRVLERLVDRIDGMEGRRA